MGPSPPPAGDADAFFGSGRSSCPSKPPRISGGGYGLLAQAGIRRDPTESRTGSRRLRGFDFWRIDRSDYGNCSEAERWQATVEDWEEQKRTLYWRRLLSVAAENREEWPSRLRSTISMTRRLLIGILEKAFSYRGSSAEVLGLFNGELTVGGYIVLVRETQPACFRHEGSMIE